MSPLLHALDITDRHRGSDRPRRPGLPAACESAGAPAQTGQATAEYALVLLGAAAVALLLVGWATHTNAIGHLLDTVMTQLERKLS